jgi:D-alanyl-lipoteichoic acid acyltransferase DltB (MBOAT superfamily)
MPSVSNYVSFAFFLPTLWVGPISPYANYASSVGTFNRNITPVGRSLLRILVGLTKYRFLATILGQLSYAGLLLDGHPHAMIDLWVAILTYPIYVFCNFSGFCDMAIGIAGLIGIHVMENFDRPFSARNFQEFWTRWHMSLSFWFRDMVFTPLSKQLVRTFGAKRAIHCMAASILTIFFLLGLWHGLSLNFAIYGITQGVGVAGVLYWTNFLKKRLGKARYDALRKNQALTYVSCAASYLYFALTLILFANTVPEIGQIWRAIRG